MSPLLTVKCFIDDRPIAADAIGPPAMNYGQLHRWEGFKQVTYEYATPPETFLELLNPWFDQFRSELKADAARGAPLEEAYEDEFAGLGYPPLAELLTRRPALATRLFLEWPLELNTVFCSESGDAIRFSANSVDRFSIREEEIRFGGIAFDMGTKASP